MVEADGGEGGERTSITLRPTFVSKKDHNKQASNAVALHTSTIL